MLSVKPIKRMKYFLFIPKFNVSIIYLNKLYIFSKEIIYIADNKKGIKKESKNELN